MIDLSLQKTKLADGFFKQYSGSKALELYKECQLKRMSLTHWFEKLDPTTDQPTPEESYDAFTRHLMALDIQLSGPNQATVDYLQNTVEYLMPEMVRREIIKGMTVASKFAYGDCIATRVPWKGSTYHPLYIPDLDLDSTKNRNEKALGKSTGQGKGGEFPKISIRRREKDITLDDEGRQIEVAYSVIRDYGWSDFAVFLNLVGAQIAIDKLYEVYQLGIAGDGTVGAAANTFNGAAGTLTYRDLVHNEASYASPFKMDRMLCPLTSYETILVMAQFMDPFAWSNKSYQISGEPITPMGGKMKQINTTPAGAPVGTVIVTLDHNFACKEVVASDLTVEAEKIISMKYENAVASEEYALCLIADGAIKRIVWT